MIFQQQLSVSERSNIRNVNAHQHNRTETFTCRQAGPLTSDLWSGFQCFRKVTRENAEESHFPIVVKDTCSGFSS